MSFYSIRPFILEYYPEYSVDHEYPASQCALINKVKDEWGIFCNFAQTPITIDGITFKSSEHLFQMMKFQDASVMNNIWNSLTANNKVCYDIKRTAKSYEKQYRRSDWGSIVVDAMKFCLMKKYEQSAYFRSELERSKGFFIVEDQTSRKITKTGKLKAPDSWGVVLKDDKYWGMNLLGELLMELRDNGKLEYKLPDDALYFIDEIKIFVSLSKK